MSDPLAHNWWAIVFRGLLAMAFGVMVLAIPRLTLLTLIVLFGVYSLVEGCLNLVAALRGLPMRERWGALAFEGGVSVVAGLVTLLSPGLTGPSLLSIIAAWAFFTGVLELTGAARLRRVIHDEWLLALGGVCSICLGVLLAVAPMIGVLAVVLWIGAYGLAFGIILVGLGIRLHAEAVRTPTVLGPMQHV